MTSKVKEENWPILMYLKDVKEQNISENQDVQRRFCSNTAFVNGLAVTILTGDYLPAIILGEIPCKDSNELNQKYIVDGMQRTSAIMKIRYGNYRITKSVENGIINYQTKRRDINGNIMMDEDQNVLWEQKSFDIRGKRFDQFPQELQDRFDKYQLHVVIHQNCSMPEVSQLVRRYNNHKAMNSSQRALTYLDNFARKAKNIADCDFFKNTMKFSMVANNNGRYENAVCEAVMSVFHIEHWVKGSQKINDYLNHNATDKEFEIIRDYMLEIDEICGNKYQDVWTLKNVPIWFPVYHRFKSYGFASVKFKEFLDAFETSLKNINIEGISYETFDAEKTTKDKTNLVKKIEIIIKLMESYFGVDSNVKTMETVEESSENLCDFVRRVTGFDADESDIEICEIQFDDLLVNVDNTSPLLNEENHKSWIALMHCWMVDDSAVDWDIKGWMIDFFGKNSSYISNQTENYKYMKDDLSNYRQRIVA